MCTTCNQRRHCFQYARVPIECGGLQYMVIYVYVSRKQVCHYTSRALSIHTNPLYIPGGLVLFYLQKIFTKRLLVALPAQRVGVYWMNLLQVNQNTRIKH